MNQPVYHPFHAAVTQNNRKLINSPLILKDGHYEIDFADLEEKIKTHKVKAAVLCSPHNPVGRVWTIEELHAYAKICRKYNVAVICDEIHADFVFKGHKHIPFAAVSEDAADRSVTCTAPSKTFNIAGLQTSNILIPNESIRNKFKPPLIHSAMNARMSWVSLQPRPPTAAGKNGLPRSGNTSKTILLLLKNSLPADCRK
ncbi:MAG: aminotransferase class I/II-fold pyridoxal phosphate-dependent enzyme [Dialister invisus]